MAIIVLLVVFFYLYGYHRDLHVLTHSFPTRRSSDLACAVTFGAHLIEPIFALALPQRDLDAPAPHAAGQIMEKADSAFDRLVFRNPAPRAGRSEEHTSELQSLMRNSYAVFCLKKKNKIIN